MALKCPVCGKEAEKIECCEYEVVGTLEDFLFSGPLDIGIQKRLRSEHGIAFKNPVERSKCRESPTWGLVLPSARCKHCRHIFPFTKETKKLAE